ncbi:MAG: exonuclease SbcCD subunit D [Dehalococcoidia bacterium]
MKILFSADWHLGYMLQGANQVPRLEDQIRQIQRIVEYIDEYDVDVLAIAGDVFEAQDRGPALAAVRRMLNVLQQPLARGLRVVAVAGNHDRDYFMETASTWLSVESGEGGGHIYFRTRPGLVPVSARGETVNFVLLPYPKPERYPVQEEQIVGAAERNQLLASVFCDEMERLQHDAAQTGLPAVLMTHVTVEGHSVNAHRLSPRDDVTIPRGRFPAFELTISGHIHKAERIGSGQFYYVGALDRMDAGERDYQPRVLLADMSPTGLRDLHSLPLDPTPIVEVSASNEEDLIREHAWMKEPTRTLVKLTLRVPYGHYTAPLIARAKELFPRLYGNVEHIWEDKPVIAPVDADLNPADVPGTIRRYLESQDLPDDEHAALMDLVDELLRS